MRCDYLYGGLHNHVLILMDSLAKYYWKLHKELFRSFSGLIENYDAKKVHKMRLVYKRIRVINKFISNELDGIDLFRHQMVNVEPIFELKRMERKYPVI